MERKIWVVILLAFSLFFIFGCKKENNIEKGNVEIKVEEIETKKVEISQEIFENLNKNLSEYISRYTVEEKNKKVGRYNFIWNQYFIYWKGSWEKLREKVLPYISYENVKYRIQTLKEQKKLTVFYDYYLPTLENKVTLNLFLFYFKIPKYKRTWENPVLAIVVDDLVEKNYWTERLFSLSYTLNLAIIPTSQGKELAEEAEKKDWYVIMHIPMESISYPKDSKYLVSYPIFTGMNKEEIEKIIDRHLNFFKDFPIEGINNHMGSKVTSDPETMKNLYEVLKEKDLFFLDSKTSYKSVGKKVAKELNIPFLENDLFIDHENDKVKIKKRFEQAIEIAKKKGRAIVICHIRPKTIEVMEELEKENFFKDVELVKLRDLLPQE